MPVSKSSHSHKSADLMIFQWDHQQISASAADSPQTKGALHLLFLCIGYVGCGEKSATRRPPLAKWNPNTNMMMVLFALYTEAFKGWWGWKAELSKGKCEQFIRNSQPFNCWALYDLNYTITRTTATRIKWGSIRRWGENDDYRCMIRQTSLTTN